MSKSLTEVFGGVSIPEELSDCAISSLKINRDNRSMIITMLMPHKKPYAALSALKKNVISFYELSAFNIRYKISDMSDFSVDDIADYVKGEFSHKKAILNYVFTDSIFEISDDKLSIRIKHGCCEYVEKEAAAISDFVFSLTGKKYKTEVIDSPEDYVPEVAPLDIAVPVRKQAPEKVSGDSDIILGRYIDSESQPINTIDEFSGKCAVTGEIFSFDTRDIKNKKLVVFNITDKTDSITCKMFMATDKFDEIKGSVKNGSYVTVRGEATMDTYINEAVINIRDINKAQRNMKTDNAEVKRVELHLHTQMSNMDGMTSAKALVKRAIQYGHPAIAITDHGVVQSFPEAFKAAKDSDIKIIYGLEGYLVDDTDGAVYDGKDCNLDSEMIVFDIETTGLNPKTERITEIGAVLVCNGEIKETFSTFSNPGKPIPERITELTGITDEMVSDAPSCSDAVASFIDFCGDRPVIAHNASFDTSFIREQLARDGKDYSPDIIDTLTLCKKIVKTKRKHNLDAMAKFFKVENPEHHRAVNDAQVCAFIWFALIERMKADGAVNLKDMNTVLAGDFDLKSAKAYHIILLAKNLDGLKNIYKLVSQSHLNYFYKTPRIPRSVLNSHREGVIVGSACEAGELFRAITTGADENKIKEICEFYDYLEIQPLGNNRFMLENGTAENEEQLKNFNREIIRLGNECGKLVVATGDVHFMDPEDEVFRRILMAGKGFDDADNQAPLYFRTTDEMINEFGYLGRDEAMRVVVENTNKIADMIEKIRPVPKEKCPPVIEGSDVEIENMCRTKAERIYGNPLPKIVEDRMNRELGSIIKNGFAVMYLIAQKLVKKSNDDGYMVGSRGSVGSSFVAFLSDITEINSLPPHYVCPSCKYSEFVDGVTVSGVDMEDKNCPKCGTLMRKDGHDIPFETFLGFDGDKAPDIDLNFSGEYQAIAHKYTEVLFGEKNVFKAGTIGTIAEKTAYGYVKKYFEEKGQKLRKAEMERLSLGCTGVKRTTSQHPGGIIVLPKGHDIHEFTPIQHPADKSESDITTTHFDYHSIDENLLKLDMLGHDDPTVIKMLEDLTGIDAKTIPLDDKGTMSLFKSTEALNLKEPIESTVGTLAVPEFGTKFVRQMLLDTKPKTMSDLIRISGLSHGTDVWLGNAQEVIKKGICPLSGCICTRDDIMLYLISMGVDAKLSFTIMEAVRKGKGLKPEWEEAMREKNVPEWYIGCCKKIKYMFPKAHAAAYVTSALRIAYFKVHYPLEFYMAYYSVRADEFDYEMMAMGHEKVKRKLHELQQASEITAKEKNVLGILEVCDEMYARGFEFCPVDIYESDAVRFLNVNGKIRPPLNSLQGLGTAAAASIAKEREKGAFISVEDILSRTTANKSVIELLSKSGCLKGIPETSQTTLFDFQI